MSFSITTKLSITITQKTMSTELRALIKGPKHDVHEDAETTEVNQQRM